MLTISITGVPAVGTEHSAVFSLKPPSLPPQRPVRALTSIITRKCLLVGTFLMIPSSAEGSSYRQKVRLIALVTSKRTSTCTTTHLQCHGL